MKRTIYTLFAATALLFTSCDDDVLDRPQLNTPTDENYWNSEADARMYANGFYTNYFVGYNSGWVTKYTPLLGYTFSDDIATSGTQTLFENKVPATRSSTSEAATDTYITQYAGPEWNFTWVRKSNIFLDRLENRMKGKMSTEAYNHWHAVAAFFKCFSYARLVSVFGDVPYFEKEIANTDKATMFKDRDNRVVVMDKVYDMLKNDVLVNMRNSDGDNILNRYVAAAYVSRWMLFEGTWQKYHNGDQAAAKKYLELAKEAAEIVMNSGKYSISTPFHELFGSQDLKGNKECLMYRHYDAAQSITHMIASYSNGVEGQAAGANLSLIKSFICQDGKVYQNSSLANASILNIANLIQTRDPRFESTFMDRANTKSSTLLYANKFIDRNAFTLADPSKVAMYASNTNTNDAPVIRYAEVLLNWIEAKAELGTVDQSDIDKSINVLRNRPLDAVAIAKGIKKTAPMNLSDITASFDPSRDADVTPIIWEIRRERRMELAFEYCRLLDIKRWKKLDYMDNRKNPDTMLGPWADLSTEIVLDPKTDIGDWFVVKSPDNLNLIIYNGTNESEMVGYYMPAVKVEGEKYEVGYRDPFTDRSYCSPIGLQDIQLYKDNGGYTLTQTIGW